MSNDDKANEMKKFFQDKLNKENMKHPMISMIKSKADEMIQAEFKSEKVSIFEATHFKHSVSEEKKYIQIQKLKETSRRYYELSKSNIKEFGRFIYLAYQHSTSPLYSFINDKYEEVIHHSANKSVITKRRSASLYMAQVKSKYNNIWRGLLKRLNIYSLSNEKAIERQNILDNVIKKKPQVKKPTALNKLVAKLTKKSITQPDNIHVVTEDKAVIRQKELLYKIYCEEAEVKKTDKLLQKRRFNNFIRMMFQIAPTWVLGDSKTLVEGIKPEKNIESIFYKAYRILYASVKPKSLGLTAFAISSALLIKYFSPLEDIKPGLLEFADQSQYSLNKQIVDNAFKYIIYRDSASINSITDINTKNEAVKLANQFNIFKAIGLFSFGIAPSYLVHQFNLNSLNLRRFSVWTTAILLFYMSFHINDVYWFIAHAYAHKRLTYILYHSNPQKRSMFEFYCKYH